VGAKGVERPGKGERAQLDSVSVEYETSWVSNSREARMSQASRASPSASSGRACLLLGLSLVLASLLLVQANKSVGTEPGDVEVIAGDVADDPRTSVATDAATEHPIALRSRVYLIEEGAELRSPVLRWLIGLLERAPPF
jgi:hypothetical protein